MFVQKISLSDTAFTKNNEYMPKSITADKAALKSNSAENHRSKKRIILGSVFALSAVGLIMLIKKGNVFNKFRSSNHINHKTGSESKAENLGDVQVPQKTTPFEALPPEGSIKFDIALFNSRNKIEIPQRIRERANIVDETGKVPDFIEGNKKFTFDKGQVASATYYDPETNLSKKVMYATEDSVEYVCYKTQKGRTRKNYNAGDIIDESYYKGNIIKNPKIKPFWTTINELYDTEGITSRMVMDRYMQSHRYKISRENYN